MKICILDDSYEGSDAPFADLDVPCDPIPYLEGHDCERHFLRKATASRQVLELSRRGFDVFVNLCDGAWDEDRPGIEVVQALERLGVSFTGATSSFFEPSREAMKLACYYGGVKFPAYAYATDDEGIAEAAARLRFPLIAKHPSSYCSIGLTRASRVETPEQLREQAARMIAAYGSTLIEEFIDGREFTVLVAENADDDLAPITYQPVEFRFPPGESFKHFDVKWKYYDDVVCVPCGDAELSSRLTDMSAKMFVALGGAGYARCDVRMDREGELFMLEINPNCEIFCPPDAAGSADLVLMNDPSGHKGFVDKILAAALKRGCARTKRWRLLFGRGNGYGMQAAQTIDEGEVIVKYEETSHVLVTRSHVLQHWNAARRAVFARYAYPLSDELYVMWSDDPDTWKPVNHSCDPNAWLDGLDVVARRRIASGEEITLDYATFCNELMDDFVCSCGSSLCREVVRGTDYLEPFVERYGDHVSEYVRNKRASADAARIGV